MYPTAKYPDAIANPEDVERTVYSVPGLVPQVDDVVARALAAGAVAPLTFLGVGMTGVVFCDAVGGGWKVARDRTPGGAVLRLVREEARWLAVASQVPYVRDHVARFVAWHEAEAVIERECVRPSRKPPLRWTARLGALHAEIERLMLAHGFGSPEFKEDSYVFTRDRGPVLVDGGMAIRVGHQLMREVADACRGAGASSFECESARWSLRMEYDRTVPEAVGRRMHDRLAAGPTHANARVRGGPTSASRPPGVPARAVPWSPQAQAGGAVRAGDIIVVMRATDGGAHVRRELLAQPLDYDGRRQGRQVIFGDDEGEDLWLRPGDSAWTWRPDAPVVLFHAEGPSVYATWGHRRHLTHLFDRVIEGDAHDPTLYFDDPAAAAANMADVLNREAGAQGLAPTMPNGARSAVSPPMFATLQKIEERGRVSRTNPGGGTEVGGDQFHTATIVALRERGLIRVERVGTRKTETDHGRGQMRYVSTVWDEPILKAWVTPKGVDVLRAHGVDALDADPPGEALATLPNASPYGSPVAAFGSSAFLRDDADAVRWVEGLSPVSWPKAWASCENPVWMVRAVTRTAPVVYAALAAVRCAVLASSAFLGRGREDEASVGTALAAMLRMLQREVKSPGWLAALPAGDAGRREVEAGYWRAVDLANRRTSGDAWYLAARHGSADPFHRADVAALSAASFAFGVAERVAPWLAQRPAWPAAPYDGETQAQAELRRLVTTAEHAAKLASESLTFGGMAEAKANVALACAVREAVPFASISRYVRRAPAGARGNDARAERAYHAGQYRRVPPYLTPGHAELPEVAEAAQWATWTTKRPWDSTNVPWGKARYLDQGNFGMAYRVQGPSGDVRLVKLPASRTLHEYAWSREEQTSNLMHEAGVANELREAGIAAVPEAVYTEFGGGTPAVVREYGEPVDVLTPAEYAALEEELVRVESDLGWRVADNLDLYRRADGSVYVGDVGFWRAPDTEPRPWKPRDTDLDLQLGKAQVKYLESALRAIDADRPRSRLSTTEVRPVATLPRLLWLAPSVADEYQRLFEGEERTSMDATFSRDLLASLEHRALLGLPDPPHYLQYAAGLAAHVDQRTPKRVPRE